LHQLRQPEVQNLHPPVLGDEQVLRLQIAMHDPLLVRRRQPICHLHGIIDSFAQPDSTTLDLFP
jgi:hypothetical protein